jgi:hypothetical protein
MVPECAISVYHQALNYKVNACYSHRIVGPAVRGPGSPGIRLKIYCQASSGAAYHEIVSKFIHLEYWIVTQRGRCCFCVIGQE